MRIEVRLIDEMITTLKLSRETLVLVSDGIVNAIRCIDGQLATLQEIRKRYDDSTPTK